MVSKKVLVTAAVLLGIIVIAALGISSLAKYTSEFYKDKFVTLKVTRTWTDTERSGDGVYTYYLVAGKDTNNKDRVIEIITKNQQNVDVVFGSLQSGQTYDFVCHGEENLSINYYYQCTTRQN
jgi:hypothetical protein